MVKIVRHMLSMLLLLASGGLLAWGLLPGKGQSMEKIILPDGMRLDPSSQTASPALLEVRRVRLEWPILLRIGDSAAIRLVFEPAADEILAPQAAVKLSDAYQAYNLMVEARLEAVGMDVQPADPRRESLPAGQVTRQTWVVKVPKAGDSMGTVWLSLRFLPLDGGKAVQTPIFVQDVQIQATSLFGLSGALARLLGGGGLIIGLALSADAIFGLATSLRKKTQSHKGHKG